MTSAAAGRRSAPVSSLLLAAAAAAVVVATAAADRTVLYPKYKSGGLVCFKDRREDGGAFWTYANDRQRRPHVFHCPSSLSAWCVNVLTGRLSVRGCSGPTGVNRAGCFHVVDTVQNVTSKVCLCKRDYCNGGPVARPSTIAAVVAVAVAAAFRPGSTGSLLCV